MKLHIYEVQFFQINTIKENNQSISKYYIGRKLREFLKMESDVASLTDVGKPLKRTAPENLNVLRPCVNLGFGK